MQRNIALKPGARLRSRAPSTPAARIRGQALVLGVVMLLVLCVGAILLFNTGQLVGKKTELTHSADAAAYSVAVQQARAWNFAAYMNRGRVANEVAIAQAISVYSWLNQLNTTSFTLKTFFNVLGSIPFPPVAIPARILYAVFNAADRVLINVRKGYRQFANTAVRLLDKFNGWYATATELAINYVSKVESLAVASDIVKKNTNQKGRVSPASWGYLSGQLLRSRSEYLDFHRVPYRGQTEAFNRYRNVVMQSRDRFTWDRTDQVGIGPIKFGGRGGTDMVEYNRWAALDTMQFTIDFPWWLEIDDIDLPVGWGGAQAVPRYSNQRFLPGFNNNRGWRSPFNNRRYKVYGSMSPRSLGTRAAAGDPNVSVHGGRARGAYFEGYRGLRSYHDIRCNRGGGDCKVQTPEDGPVFTVEAVIDMKEARTASELGIGAGRMESREPTDRIAAVASSQVYFRRPPAQALFQRADRNREIGSLFSPYWQARLVETPPAALAALAVGSGL